MNMGLRPRLPGWTPSPKKSFLSPDLQQQNFNLFLKLFLVFICGAGMPSKHWIHYILHRMTGRRYFWTDIGKWGKRKLNLNVYFLWVPISRFADPCFPVHLALWSTGVSTREFVLTSSCHWEHRSALRSWAGHPENEEHKLTCQVRTL